jgi:hypothetical protein
VPTPGSRAGARSRKASRRHHSPATRQLACLTGRRGSAQATAYPLPAAQCRTALRSCSPHAASGCPSPLPGSPPTRHANPSLSAVAAEMQCEETSTRRLAFGTAGIRSFSRSFTSRRSGSQVLPSTTRCETAICRSAWHSVIASGRSPGPDLADPKLRTSGRVEPPADRVAPLWSERWHHNCMYAPLIGVAFRALSKARGTREHASVRLRRSARTPLLGYGNRISLWRRWVRVFATGESLAANTTASITEKTM